MDTATPAVRPSILGPAGRHVSPTTVGLVGAGQVREAVERVSEPAHVRLMSDVGPVALPTYSPGAYRSRLRLDGSRRRNRGHRWRSAGGGQAAQDACRPRRDRSKHRYAFRGGLADGHPRRRPGLRSGGQRTCVPTRDSLWHACTQSGRPLCHRTRGADHVCPDASELWSGSSDPFDRKSRSSAANGRTLSSWWIKSPATVTVRAVFGRSALLSQARGLRPTPSRPTSPSASRTP